MQIHSSTLSATNAKWTPTPQQHAAVEAIPLAVFNFGSNKQDFAHLLNTDLAFPNLTINLHQLTQYLRVYCGNYPFTGTDVYAIGACAEQAIGGAEASSWHLIVDGPILTPDCLMLPETVIWHLMIQFLRSLQTVMTSSHTLSTTYDLKIDAAPYCWRFRMGHRLTIDFTTKPTPNLEYGPIEKGWVISLITGYGRYLKNYQTLTSESVDTSHAAITAIKTRHYVKTDERPACISVLGALANAAQIDDAAWKAARASLLNTSVEALTEAWINFQHTHADSVQFYATSFLHLLWLAEDDNKACKKAAEIFLSGQSKLTYQMEPFFAEAIEKHPELTPMILKYISGIVLYQWLAIPTNQHLQAFTFQFNDHPHKPRPFIELPRFQCALHLAVAHPLSSGSPLMIQTQFDEASRTLSNRVSDLKIKPFFLNGLYRALGLRTTRFVSLDKMRNDLIQQMANPRLRTILEVNYRIPTKSPALPIRSITPEQKDPPRPPTPKIEAIPAPKAEPIPLTLENYDLKPYQVTPLLEAYGKLASSSDPEDVTKALKDFRAAKHWMDPANSEQTAILSTPLKNGLADPSLKIPAWRELIRLQKHERWRTNWTPTAELIVEIAKSLISDEMRAKEDVPFRKEWVQMHQFIILHESKVTPDQFKQLASLREEIAPQPQDDLHSKLPEPPLEVLSDPKQSETVCDASSLSSNRKQKKKPTKASSVSKLPPVEAPKVEEIKTPLVEPPTSPELPVVPTPTPQAHLAKTDENVNDSDDQNLKSGFTTAVTNNDKDLVERLLKEANAELSRNNFNTLLNETKTHLNETLGIAKLYSKTITVNQFKSIVNQVITYLAVYKALDSQEAAKIVSQLYKIIFKRPGTMTQEMLALYETAERLNLFPKNNEKEQIRLERYRSFVANMNLDIHADYSAHIVTWITNIQDLSNPDNLEDIKQFHLDHLIGLRYFLVKIITATTPDKPFDKLFAFIKELSLKNIKRSTLAELDSISMQIREVCLFILYSPICCLAIHQAIAEKRLTQEQINNGETFFHHLHLLKTIPTETLKKLPENNVMNILKLIIVIYKDISWPLANKLTIPKAINLAAPTLANLALAHNDILKQYVLQMGRYNSTDEKTLELINRNRVLKEHIDACWKLSDRTKPFQEDLEKFLTKPSQIKSYLRSIQSTDYKGD